MNASHFQVLHRHPASSELASNLTIHHINIWMFTYYIPVFCYDPAGVPILKDELKLGLYIFEELT